MRRLRLRLAASAPAPAVVDAAADAAAASPRTTASCRRRGRAAARETAASTPSRSSKRSARTLCRRSSPRARADAVTAPIVLRICLERRRFEGLFNHLASEAAARDADEAAAARRRRADAGEVADCTSFSPFVYSWIEAAATSIQSWLSAAVRRQEAWLPLSSELLWSPTVAHLFSASFALLRTLRRLRVVFHGELVAAAQLLSDAHLALATALLPSDAAQTGHRRHRSGSPPLR